MYKMSDQGVSNNLTFCKSVIDSVRLPVWSELGSWPNLMREKKISGDEDTK